MLAARIDPRLYRALMQRKLAQDNRQVRRTLGHETIARRAVLHETIPRRAGLAMNAHVARDSIHDPQLADAEPGIKRRLATEIIGEARMADLDYELRRLGIQAVPAAGLGIEHEIGFEQRIAGSLKLVSVMNSRSGGRRCAQYRLSAPLSRS
jgi:hypothetical protein